MLSPEIGALATPLIYLALAGVFAGFMSGLLGIGGGFIVVPALYLLAEPLGIEPALAMHMALGTSLAAMIATTYRSARAHDARGAVDWVILRRLFPAVLTGAVMGALFATQLKGPALTGIFACVGMGLAARTYWGQEPDPKIVRPPLALWIQYGLAWIVGSVSAVVGIGGVALGAPLLTRLGLPFHRVIGTAAWFGVTIACPSALIYAFPVALVDARPPLSLGYVNLPGCLLILLTTSLTNRYGVALNARLSPLALRRVFAIFLLSTSLRMAWSIV